MHAGEQADTDYLEQWRCKGRSPRDRAADKGISANGENIAWGYTTPEAVTAGWMSSETGHCDAIMNGGFTEAGTGYVMLSGRRLWVTMFR